MSTNRKALATIPEGICWIFGLAAAVLGELDYRGLTDNPIPDAVTAGIVSLGSILLLVGLVGIRRIQKDRGTSSGRPGYYITLAGLAITAISVWPFVVVGPMIVAIGVTVYGGTTLASGSIRSLGAWMHALSIPVGVVTGFAFAWGGYDGGFGIATSVVLISAGFMSLGYDVAAPPPAVVSREVTA